MTAARAADGDAASSGVRPGLAAGTDAYSPISGPLRDVLATSQDWSLRPHNETSIAVNPTNPLNIIVGMNDYHLGFGMSGYAVSQDDAHSAERACGEQWPRA